MAAVADVYRMVPAYKISKMVIRFNDREYNACKFVVICSLCYLPLLLAIMSGRTHCVATMAPADSVGCMYTLTKYHHTDVYY